MIIEVSGRKLAIGTHWHILAAISEKQKEVRDFYRTHRHDAVVSIGKGRNTSVLGVFPDTPVSGTVYSAILGLATVYKNAIIRHQLSDGRIWIAGILNGNPTPNHDLICSPEEVITKTSTLRSFLPNAISIGSDVEARHTLAEALNAVDKAVWKKFIVSVPAVKSRKRNILLTLLVIALVALLAGTVSYRMLKTQQAASDAAMMQQSSIDQIQSQSSRDYLIAYQQALEAQQHAFRQGIGTAVALHYLNQQIAALPTVHNGWRRAALTCDFTAQTCRNDWVRTGYAMSALAYTLPGGIDAPPQAVLGQTVQQHYPIVGITPGETILLNSPREALHYISISEMYQAGAVNLQSTLGFTPRIATVPHPPEGVSPLPVPTLGLSAPWRLTLPLYVIGPVAHYFDGPGIQVQTATVRFDARPTIEINGVFIASGEQSS